MVQAITAPFDGIVAEPEAVAGAQVGEDTLTRIEKTD